MTSPEPQSETLDEAREELARRLEEACQTGTAGGPPETTGELIRLEGADRIHGVGNRCPSRTRSRAVGRDIDDDRSRDSRGVGRNAMDQAEAADRGTARAAWNVVAARGQARLCSGV
jgi:hypothetical protein